MEHFPFKKVTVTSGGEAGRTAVKESLNFSSARSRVHFVVQLRLTENAYTSDTAPLCACLCVCVGQEVDATGRFGRKETCERKKLVE